HEGALALGVARGLQVAHSPVKQERGHGAGVVLLCQALGPLWQARDAVVLCLRRLAGLGHDCLLRKEKPPPFEREGRGQSNVRASRYLSSAPCHLTVSPAAKVIFLALAPSPMTTTCSLEPSSSPRYRSLLPAARTTLSSMLIWAPVVSEMAAV